MKKYLVGVGSLALLLPGLAFAAGTGPDFTVLTSGVDFTTTIAAVLAIFAAVAGLDLAWAGGRKILHAIRGA